MDGVDGLTGKSSAAQTHEVDTSVADGLLTGNDVRRNILTGTSAPLEHHIAAYTDELVEQTGGGDNSKVIDFHLSGEFRGVADDTAITNHTVVGHMHVLHQQVSRTYHGLALRGCTTRDCDVLTDGVVVADLTGCLLALELEVLGLGGDAGTREELIPVADASTKMDGHIVEELVIVANHNVLINDTERTNDVAVTKFCLGINDS